jgi:isochorismate synthase
MNFLSGLKEVGSYEGGLGAILSIIAFAEMEGIPFELVEAAGSYYLGLGQPAAVDEVDLATVEGPIFIRSGFLPGSRTLRSYPMVAVGGSNRLEVRMYELKSGAIEDYGLLKVKRIQLDSRRSLLTDIKRFDRDSVLTKIGFAIAAIESGQLRKLVISGYRSYLPLPGFSVATALARLRRVNPKGNLYANSCGFGVSPELVLKKTGDSLILVPLAGTAPRGKQATLLKSTKDHLEHQYLVDQIREDLAGHVKEVKFSNEPILHDAGPFIHLATPMRAVALPGHSIPIILDAITPTAAVSGFPRMDAVAHLARIEPERGCYGGYVGLMSPDGDGEVHLAIRGVFTVEDQLRIFGGGGVVSESNPDAEIAELDGKILSMARVLGAL